LPVDSRSIVLDSDLLALIEALEARNAEVFEAMTVMVLVSVWFDATAAPLAGVDPSRSQTAAGRQDLAGNTGNPASARQKPATRARALPRALPHASPPVPGGMRPEIFCRQAAG
jgi:hypothetical protein